MKVGVGCGTVLSKDDDTMIQSTGKHVLKVSLDISSAKIERRQWTLIATFIYSYRAPSTPFCLILVWRPSLIPHSLIAVGWGCRMRTASWVHADSQHHWSKHMWLHICSGSSILSQAESGWILWSSNRSSENEGETWRRWCTRVTLFGNHIRRTWQTMNGKNKWQVALITRFSFCRCLWGYANRTKICTLWVWF